MPSVSRTGKPVKAFTRNPPDYSEGLPANPLAERVVLACILKGQLALDAVRKELVASDFTDPKNQRVYARMDDLWTTGRPIDTVILGEELARRKEVKDGILAHLTDLDEDLPELAHPEAYVAIVREKAARRCIIHGTDALAKRALLETEPIEDISRSGVEFFRDLNARSQHDKDAVLIEIPSTWGYELPLNHLIDDLLIEGAVTMWSGESGDGKSTLALSLAAAVASGQPFLGRRTIQRAVVYLDRENPVSIINERLERLGVPRELQMDGRLRIWGAWWQDHYPMGPEAAPIIAHAGRVRPLFIWDSLVGFANCDENSAFEMRRHTSHYRHLASIGATNLVIHHRSEKSESKYRGSTDIRANMDAAWEVARDGNSNAADALGRMRLTPYKTRNHPGKAIRVEYRDGIFVPLDAPTRPPVEIVVDLVRSHPGANQKEMKKLGPPMGLSEHRTVAAIEEAILEKKIIPRRTRHNVIRYYLPETFLTSSAEAPN